MKLLIILVAGLVQADECLLLDGAPEHMRDVCKMQTYEGCKMMEKQMNCYWSSANNGMCVPTEWAPKHMVDLCHIQTYNGCKMMEEKGHCYWKPFGKNA